MTPGRAILAVLVLAVGCQSPPASAPVSTVPPEPAVNTTQPVGQAPQSAAEAPPTSIAPVPVRESSAVEAKNAADLEAMKAALLRTVRPSPAASGLPGQIEPADETLAERDLAAARESLPALQERMEQMIPRHFDAETLRRILTTHPELRKD
jgi:hypothetical protein